MSEIKLEQRKVNIDIFRGILMLMVVCGHYNIGVLHTIIYWFHMPLFFILSGTLFKIKKIDREYIQAILKKMYLPFLFWAAIIYLIDDRSNILKYFLKVLWGGRLLPGVFWYINCYIISSIVLQMIMKMKKSIVVSIIAGMYILAVLESNIIWKYNFFEYDLLPWAVDISLMAVGYMYIGVRLQNYKSIIDERMYNLFLTAAFLISTGFIAMQSLGVINYQYDMKKLLYTNILLNVVIPLSFWILLEWICQVLTKIPVLNSILSYIGRHTLVIMYLHLSINRVIGKVIQLNIFEYLLFGVLVPIIINYVFVSFIQYFKEDNRN